jgi:hypothetical protein
LWGLSTEVVQISALHHYPSRSEDKAFSALTAVHVANALEYEGAGENDGLPVPEVDVAYLRALGLEKRLPIWRVAHHESDWTQLQSQVQRAKPQPKAVPKPAAPAPEAKSEPKRAVRVETPPRPVIWQGLWRWMGIGVGATAALLLLARLEIMRLENQAAEQAVQHSAAMPPPASRREMAATVTPDQKPVGTRVTAAPTNAAIKIEPTNAPPVIAAQTRPTNGTLQGTLTNAPPVVAAQGRPVTPAAPEKTALDRLKLDAIFYSSQHPRARINGTFFSVGQEVAQCRVLNISPNSVTLEYQNQQKTLTMK